MTIMLVLNRKLTWTVNIAGSFAFEKDFYFHLVSLSKIDIKELSKVKYWMKALLDTG